MRKQEGVRGPTWMYTPRRIPKPYISLLPSKPQVCPGPAGTMERAFAAEMAIETTSSAASTGFSISLFSGGVLLVPRAVLVTVVTVVMA